MNILFINHYAGSEKHGMEFRPYYLAKEWCKMGHDVTILASSFSHIRKVNPTVVKDFQEEMIDGIRYVFMKNKSYKGNGIIRILSMIIFPLKLYLKASFIAKKYKPDAVITASTYPLDTYGGKKTARLSNASYTHEVHDLWPLSPIELGGYSKKHPFILLMQAAEDYAYNNCDNLVSTLSNSYSYMKTRGLKEDKFHYINNGVNVEEWDNDKEEIDATIKENLDALKEEGYFLVGYTGGHATSNALIYLIDAAKLLADEKIKIILVGDGDQKSILMNEVSQHNLKNVLFFDKVNKKCIPQLLSFFDVLYIGWNNTKLYEYGVSPNKIFDYMLAQKPVLHSINNIDDIISTSKGGIVVKTSAEDIAAGIMKLLSKSTDELNEMGENGRKYAIENNNYEILAKRYLDVIK